MKLATITPSISLLLALALPACGNKDSDTTSAKDVAKAAATPEAKADDPAKADGEAEAKADDAAEAKADDAAEAKADEGTDAEAGAAEAGAAEAGTAEAGAAEAGAAEAGAAEAGDEAAAEDGGDEVQQDPGSTVRLSSLYWASPVDGKTGIDIIDVAIEGEIDPVMSLAEANDSPDGFERALPASAKLPKGFAVGNEWIVATTAGEKRGKAVAFGASGGASESHFTVVLDAEATGLVARAKDWNGKVPTLREVKGVELARGEKLREAIWPSIVAAAEGDAKSRLRRPLVWKGALVAVEGKFPEGFTHLVSIMPDPDGDIGEDQPTGLVLADATGRVKVVFPPRMSIDSYEAHYLVDLEGDGQDEVVLDSSYYEGSYTLLMAWNSRGEMLARTLTGDGA
ncbi:MAG: hypothetical protein H6712_12650 [Myxococcales bacterium]|nr:hypothetical protein [Myxococcales bacterium]